MLDGFRPFKQYVQDSSLQSPTQSPSLKSPDLSLWGWITSPRKGTLIPPQSNLASSGLTGNITYHPAVLTMFSLGNCDIKSLCSVENVTTSSYLSSWEHDGMKKSQLKKTWYGHLKKWNLPCLWAHRVINPQSEVFEAPRWILKTFSYWINTERLLLLGRRPKKCPKAVLVCFRYYINQDWNIQAIILFLLPLDSGLFGT